MKSHHAKSQEYCPIYRSVGYNVQIPQSDDKKSELGVTSE